MNREMAYSKDELQKLLEKAQDFHESRVNRKGFHPCPVLYRNKDEKYFNDILNGDGIMETSFKEVENSPRCPVNEKLKGVYFCCNVMDGKPKETSPFGDTRLLCPYSMIADCSLYFADFYCYDNSKHYVTIVAAKSGSEAQKVCDALLINKSEPFLFFDEYRVFQVSCVRELWIELFFTENIDISGAEWLNDFSSFRQNGNGMGLLRNIKSTFGERNYAKSQQRKMKRGCELCNIDEMMPLQAQRQQKQVSPQTDNRVLATKSRSSSSKVPQAPPTPPPPHEHAEQNAYQQQGGHRYINSSADADAQLPERIQRVQLSQSAGRSVDLQSRSRSSMAPPTRSHVQERRRAFQQQGGDGYFQGTPTAPPTRQVLPTYPTPNPYPGQPAFPLSQQANVGAQTSHTSGMLGQDPAGWGGGNQALAGMNYRPRHGRR